MYNILFNPHNPVTKAGQVFICFIKRKVKLKKDLSICLKATLKLLSQTRMQIHLVLQYHSAQRALARDSQDSSSRPRNSETAFRGSQRTFPSIIVGCSFSAYMVFVTEVHWYLMAKYLKGLPEVTAQVSLTKR